MSTLKTPEHMPVREPDLKTLDIDPIERCSVPGVSDDTEEGTLFFYDQPLLFVAKIENQLVFVTLTDEDYTNDGMRDGYADGAKGWQQYIAISVPEDLLRKVYYSQLPLRALYDQENAQTWFVHKNWCSLRIETIDRFDPRNWYSVFRVWRNMAVLDAWKSKPGTYLNPNKKDA